MRGSPALVAPLMLAVLAGPVRGQVGDTVAPEAPPRPPLTGGWAGWTALPHPWSTVVALTAVLPVGSGEDPEGQEGTAWLLGQASAAAVRSRLGEAGLQVEARVDRTRTVIRVLTVPGAWTHAYGVLERVLFEDSGAAPDFQGPRDGLLAVHAFEAGAPVREFEREMYRMLSGAADPWSRDPRGLPETLERITQDDLDAFRRRHWDRSTSIVSVTGAVDPDDMARVVTGDPSTGERTDGSRVAVRVEPGPPGSPAWTEPDRTHLVRDVTSGWIAAAYPVAPGLSRTAAEMVVHRARSELVTEPPAPGLFSAEVGLEDLPGGRTALLVRVAVLPESVEGWETRIVETLARISAEPLEAGFFRFHRRQFRNLRLVDDASPEAEGLRAALDVARRGRPRDLPGEIWALDAEALHTAASALGPPRILVFGPDLTAEGGASGGAGGAGAP